jgi:hypothetical protein
MTRILFSAMAVLMVASTAAASLPMIPVPAHVDARDGILPIDSSFSVSLRGRYDRRLRSAVDRLVNRIERETGIPFHRSESLHEPTASRNREMMNHISLMFRSMVPACRRIHRSAPSVVLRLSGSLSNSGPPAFTSLHFILQTPPGSHGGVS